MAMARVQSRPQARMTEEEFMRLPDDGRKYELVNGEATEVPTNFRHDEISVRLTVLIWPSAQGRGSMTNGQAGFRMKNGNIRCPDVSFTRKERLPGGRTPNTFGDAAPDLCVEIISPSEDEAEMARKVREYFESGAEQVWHLFPEMQTVVRYTAPDAAVTCGADDLLEGGDLLPGFACRVGDLFIGE